MAEDAVLPSLVIDNGSWAIKSGFSTDEEPRAITPTIYGVPKYITASSSTYKQDFYIGNEVCDKMGILIASFPIQHRIIQNWDQIQKIWSFIFEKELGVADLSERSVILSESPITTNHDKMAQIMFEIFGVQSFLVVNQALLALYGSGRSTGIVCDIGDSACDIIPIKSYTSHTPCTTRLNISGQDLTAWMMKLIHTSGFTFTRTTKRNVVQEIKEKESYIALDFEAELQRALTTNDVKSDFEYSESQVIHMNQERFKCPELLFKPRMNGIEEEGIHTAIYNSIMKSEIDIRSELFSNIVLSGGSTMFEGLAERLEKEVSNLAPQGTKVKVIAPPKRKYLTWMGGSILSSLTTFPEMCITREEYFENGPGIVSMKLAKL